uniref:Uncharacterized protein n=1 Tax=Mola mola TaxID=94237 RepID=A0A3Q3WX45_MOLML
MAHFLQRVPVRQIYRLLQCVHRGDKVQIEKLVTLGVKGLINLTEPEDGIGVLHVAALDNNLDLVDFLLSMGAHPDVQDKQGCTAAMVAAQLGMHTIVALLCQSHANLKLPDEEGRSLLFYCSYPTKNHTRCAQEALKFHADVNNVSLHGTHVFQLMCQKAHGYTPLCQLLLDNGADPNAANQKTGVTALMEAAKVGSLQLVRIILQKGGNPNALDVKRRTAVHYAAMGGFLEVILVLSAYSADMSLIDIENCTPLHYAAAEGNPNCCKFLAQRGCNPKLKNLEGLLPRQIANDADHKAAAKELKKAEKQQGNDRKPSGGGLMSEVWVLTLHDWSHVYEAELWEAFENQGTVTNDMFISVLEKLKAPVEGEQLRKIILAHNKRRHGYVDINEFIKGVMYIEKPFLVSSYMAKTKKGQKGGKGGKKGTFVIPFPICTFPPELMPRRPHGGPPYFLIQMYYNCSDSRQLDCNQTAEHPIMNDSGWYIDKPEEVYVNINHCVKNGDLESLDLAVSQGVPVDIQDPFYKTPLMVACSSGNYEVAQYLLSRGADVNMQDQFLWTPLHHAAHAGHVELIELLIEAGAPIDTRALSEGTPLMRAIESSRPSCVDILIKAGASVYAENKKGQNCFDIAIAFGDSRIIDLIIENMDSLSESKEKAEGKGGKPSKNLINSLVNCSVCVHCNFIYGYFNDLSVCLSQAWGKPTTTSQLMSKTEREKELLSFELDSDDFMMPFNQNMQGIML